MTARPDDLDLTPDRWARIRAELAERAAAAGLLDVAVEHYDSPLGPMLVAATADGVVRVGLPAEDAEAVLDDLARRVSPRVLRAARPATTAAQRQLDEYFAGRRRAFELPLDWRLTTGFRRAVLQAAQGIAYGTTATYGDVAAQAGSAAAVRAAGTALATNPLPIVIPCHRVVRAGGALGAYLGGPEAKARLLELERRHVA